MTRIIQTLKQLRSEGIEGYFAIKYAEFAKDTPTMQEAYANLADRIAAVMSEGSFLEVGPGPAFVSIEISKRIPRVQIIGLDISETMSGIGRRNVAEAGLSQNAHYAVTIGDEVGLKEIIEPHIDELAAQVWGLSSDELNEIRVSLEEMG